MEEDDRFKHIRIIPGGRSGERNQDNEEEKEDVYLYELVIHELNAAKNLVMRDPVARDNKECDYKNYELAIHPGEDPGQKCRSLLIRYRRYCQAYHHECHGKGKYTVTQRFDS